MGEYDFDVLWDEDHPEQTEHRLQDLLKQSRFDVDPHYHCQLLTQIARAQGKQHKFEAANKTLDHALQIMGDMTSITFARYLLERGRVYYAAGDRLRATTFFWEAWSMSNRVQADEYAIDAAQLVANVQRTPERQLEWRLRALSRAQDTDCENATQRFGALYEQIGWTYHQLGQFDIALDYFQRAVDFRQRQGDVKALSMAKWFVGRVLRSLNKCEDAHRIQADLLAESQRMGRDVAGIIYEELGECLRCLERTSEAQTYFSLAYEALSKDPDFCSKEPSRLDRIKALASGN